MAVNVSNTVSLPLYPTRTSKTPCNSICASSTDDKMAELAQLASPALRPITEFRYPQKDQPTPIFAVGRYRFPAPHRRLLPIIFTQPQHAPLHPGTFPSPQFEDEIWPSTPLYINDSHIASMSPEHTYFGIDHIIDVHDSAWNKQLISRGTTIVFRNYTSGVTRYIATWKLETVRKHDYVQFSPFRVNQMSCYQDPDWPTIRITVPTALCKVPTSPLMQGIMKPAPIIITRDTPKWYEYLCCYPCSSATAYDDNDEDFLKF